MTERWEKSINDWYEKSHAANLEYLDLVSLPIVSNNNLAHNLACIYNRLSLHSRISIKDYYSLLDRLKSLEVENQKLRKEIKHLSQVVLENRPVTKSQLLEVAEQIASQPKAIEQQTVRLANNLAEKLERLELIVKRLEG
ncbi:hypothetical protein KM718_gp1 [Polyscias mosaic virus]|uniref:Uncharacterized protein n=1 Tax=Polyscias mosaic virus TaxID=2528410 RepID=A0A481S8W3_9VIRU|nr:hypothetical protein KM718_gp1 [Polyscias mosaic virus]QBH21731.1 hypothetical protein [Polyscias mosaic virus]